MLLNEISATRSVDLVFGEPLLLLGQNAVAVLVALDHVEAVGANKGHQHIELVLGGALELGERRDEVLRLAKRALLGAEGEGLVQDLAVQGMTHHRAVQLRELLLEGEFGGVGQIVSSERGNIHRRLGGCLLALLGIVSRHFAGFKISHACFASQRMRPSPLTYLVLLLAASPPRTNYVSEVFEAVPRVGTIGDWD